MKTIFILACSLLTVHSVLAQCDNNVKIISPISPKPTAPVVSLTCTSFTVKWKGQTGQTFVLNVTVKDAQTNKVIKTITTPNYTFDGTYYTSAVEATAGTLVNWNVEAITVVDNRTFYSYPLRDPKDYPVPKCESTIATSSTDKNSLLSVVKDKNMKVRIYPNPVQSILKVEFNDAASSNKIINIFSVSGKAVITQRTSANLAQIDFGQLNTGIYFIKITDASGRVMFSGKVVKE